MPTQKDTTETKRSSKEAATVPTVKSSTIQEVRANVNPQLCKVYNQDKHDWTKDWVAEPKFDGLRCIVIIEHTGGRRWIRPYSRNGKPLWNMEIILDDLDRCVPFGQDTVLDGEIYTKDWNLSMGITKSSVTTHADADKLRYHVWDCLTLEEWNSSWTDNRKVVHSVYACVSNLDRKKRLSFLEGSLFIEIVQSVPVTTRLELEHVYSDLLNQGYEGAILKQPGAAYYGGRRSPYWLKIKPWSDADLTVVGAYAGEGKHLGRLGGFVLEGEGEWNGTMHSIHTEVGTGFTDEERETFQKMWDEGRLDGRIVEIKFQDITVEGACRFPVFHRLREDKE